MAHDHWLQVPVSYPWREQEAYSVYCLPCTPTPPPRNFWHLLKLRILEICALPPLSLTHRPFPRGVPAPQKGLEQPGFGLGSCAWAGFTCRAWLKEHGRLRAGFSCGGNGVWLRLQQETPASASGLQPYFSARRTPPPRGELREHGAPGFVLWLPRSGQPRHSESSLATQAWEWDLSRQDSPDGRRWCWCR